MRNIQQQTTGQVALEARRSGSSHRRYGGLLLGFALSLFLGACASQSMAPPVADMARAEASIDSAIQAGAQEAAPLELQSAQSHFSQAQQANANEEYQQALWLAEKSQADANLAETKARTERVYTTVAELKEGIRVLEDELERDSRLNIN